MKRFQGTIIEIQQSEAQSRAAVVRLAGNVRILPGQYFQARHPGDTDQPVGVNLFPGGFNRPQPDGENLLTTAPPIPANWQPGEILWLHGPLGKGFSLPADAGRVALIALNTNSAPLLPLASTALAQNAEVVLFTDGSFPKLPPNIEISPLAALADAAGWADYTALYGSWEEVQQAKEAAQYKELRGKVEVLIRLPMPCSGLASCGICAITDHKGKTHMVCEEGPVFDWREI